MALVLLALLGIGFTVRPEPDPDLWGHLRFGQYSIEAGLPPQPDIFSYASDVPWVNHEWLSEIVYFLAWKNLGDAGYFLIKAICGVIIAVFLLYHSNRKNSPLLASAIVFASAFLCLGNGMLLRPQLFTYVFTACFVHACLLNRENRPGWLYVCPILAVIWANAHAGIVAGIGLMTLFLAGDMFECWLARRRGEPAGFAGPRRLAVILALCVAATLLNPYGVSYWKFLWEATTLDRKFITEWAPMTWSMDNAAYLICASVFTFAFIRSRQKKTPAELIVFGVTLYLGLNHYRHMMLFAIAVGMTIAPHVAACFPVKLVAGTASDDLSPEETRRLRILYAGSILLISGAIVFALARQGMRISVDPARYPVAATRFIQANHITGNLYPTFNWGQYAIWHLHPKCLVGADGRYETVYSRKHESSQMAFDVGADNWAEVLDSYPAEIVMCPNQLRHRLAMGSRLDFVKVYDDTSSLVFLKRIPRFDTTIAKAAKNELVRPAAAPREYFP